MPIRDVLILEQSAGRRGSGGCDRRAWLVRSLLSDRTPLAPPCAASCVLLPDHKIENRGTVCIFSVVMDVVRFRICRKVAAIARGTGSHLLTSRYFCIDVTTGNSKSRHETCMQ